MKWRLPRQEISINVSSTLDVVLPDLENFYVGFSSFWTFSSIWWEVIETENNDFPAKLELAVNRQSFSKFLNQYTYLYVVFIRDCAPSNVNLFKVLYQVSSFFLRVCDCHLSKHLSARGVTRRYTCGFVYSWILVSEYTLQY